MAMETGQNLLRATRRSTPIHMRSDVGGFSLLRGPLSTGDHAHNVSSHAGVRAAKSTALRGHRASLAEQALGDKAVTISTESGLAASLGGRALFVNGKFTAQRGTGVQRVAHSLLMALDRGLASSAPAARVILLHPPGAAIPPLRHVEPKVLGSRHVPLHAWEQGLLPVAARAGLLLNLAGSAPWLARRQVCLVHDAAVFDCPEAYSFAFRHWYRMLFRHLPRRHATLLTVSGFSRQRLAQHLGIAASSIGIVPNGGGHLDSVVANSAVLVRHGLEPGRYFVAVGTSNPNKNLDRLTQAFGRLRSFDGVKLVIVGGSDTRVFASRRTRAEPDMAGVVRTGILDDGSLKALYMNAIALAFPSLYEGFGLPPLEAMSCGCPVTASGAAAIPEVCGNAALYFDASSVEQMQAAMQRLMDEPQLRDQLRRAGAVQVLRFDWDAAARALVEHLHAANSASQP
jgi:glycosyltransferase involved in cell wall biosynthesis